MSEECRTSWEKGVDEKYFPRTLTKRETEVLTIAAEGKTNKEISNLLYMNKRTVDYHLDRAYKKLGAHNRVMAIRIAMEKGILK